MAPTIGRRVVDRESVINRTVRSVSRIARSAAAGNAAIRIPDRADRVTGWCVGETPLLAWLLGVSEMGSDEIRRHGAPGSERPIVSAPYGLWRDLTPTRRTSRQTLLSRREADLGLAALPIVERVDRFGPPLTNIGKVICIGSTTATLPGRPGPRRRPKPIVFLKTPTRVVGPDDDVLIRARPAIRTGMLSSRSSSGPRPGTWTARTARRPASRGTRSATKSASGSSSWSAAASGTRARTARRSTRSGRGSARPTRAVTRGGSACGWGERGASPARYHEDMIFDVPYLVWYLSQFMVLRPGDVINTGTPAGVALAGRTTLSAPRRRGGARDRPCWAGSGDLPRPRPDPARGLAPNWCPTLPRVFTLP